MDCTDELFKETERDEEFWFLAAFGRKSGGNRLRILADGREGIEGCEMNVIDVKQQPSGWRSSTPGPMNIIIIVRSINPLKNKACEACVCGLH